MSISRHFVFIQCSRIFHSFGLSCGAPEELETFSRAFYNSGAYSGNTVDYLPRFLDFLKIFIAHAFVVMKWLNTKLPGSQEDHWIVIAPKIGWRVTLLSKKGRIFFRVF